MRNSEEQWRDELEALAKENVRIRDVLAAAAAFEEYEEFRAAKAALRSFFLYALWQLLTRQEVSKQVMVGVDVFGKPTDWDPKCDNDVRSSAARLRTILANYYRGRGADEFIRFDMERGGYGLTVTDSRAIVLVPAPCNWPGHQDRYYADLVQKIVIDRINDDRMLLASAIDSQSPLLHAGGFSLWGGIASDRERISVNLVLRHGDTLVKSWFSEDALDATITLGTQLAANIRLVLKVAAANEAPTQMTFN